MATQRDDKEELEHRTALLIERFHQAEKRALLRRGIELWIRTERGALGDVTLPEKIN